MSSIGLASLPTSTSTSSSSTSDPTNVVATAVSTGSPLSATATPASNNCEIEKKQNAIVGGTIGGLFGAMAVGLAAALFWMHKQELRQRKLKEHYEEQFSQTAAYRRVLASSAASLMGTDTRDELNTKSGGAWRDTIDLGAEQTARQKRYSAARSEITSRSSDNLLPVDQTVS
jgi:hypothetical protein